MQSRRIHLLNSFGIKKNIDKYIETLIDDKIDLLKDEVYFLKSLVKEKENELESLREKTNLLEKKNQKLSSDLAIVIQAISSLFYVKPVYVNGVANKDTDDDDEDIYH